MAYPIQLQHHLLLCFGVLHGGGSFPEGHVSCSMRMAPALPALPAPVGLARADQQTEFSARATNASPRIEKQHD